MANKKYKLTDGNYWATDGVYDFDQTKTQREINGELSDAVSDLSTAIKAVVVSNAYTPTITIGSVVPTTDNPNFRYTVIGDGLLVIQGRVQIINKNTTATNAFLNFSLPSGYTVATGLPIPLGFVFTTNEISDFTLRPQSYGASSIILALGGGGGYSSGLITNGEYYGFLAIIPVEKST